MTIATYNIMSGGFPDYSNTTQHPKRLELLQQAIKQVNADFIGLVDTFCWRDLFSDQDLQNLFGYKYAYHINMDATEVDPKIGLAIMTNLEITGCEDIRLATRSAIKTTVIVDHQPIDIYTLYLHHADEDLRLKQAQTLVDQLGSNPAIVLGDFNSVPLQNAQALKTEFEKAIQENLSITTQPSFEPLKQRFENYCRGEVLPLFESQGFSRAFDQQFANTGSFTKLAKDEFPSQKFNTDQFQVDHIFTSRELTFQNFRVFSGDIFEKASDHYPIRIDFSVVL